MMRAGPVTILMTPAGEEATPRMRDSLDRSIVIGERTRRLADTMQRNAGLRG